MTARPAPQAGRLLMSLYPVRYRALHGEDIAAVFARTAEGLPRRAVLRERFDLAAHALRLRLRIGPTDPAGRVLAGAAPVTLAIAAGRCLFFLLSRLHERVHRIRYPFPGSGLGHAVLDAVLLVAGTLPWLLALALAAVGRWRAARITGLLAALVEVGIQELEGIYQLWLVGYLLGLLLVGALLLLAPPDLVDVTKRGRWEAAGLALGVGLPLIAADRYQLTRHLSLNMATVGLFPLWLCAATAVVLLLRLSGRRPDGLRAAGVALAVLPWLVHLVFAAVDDPARELRRIVRYGGACLVLLGLAAALAAAVHLVRRTWWDKPTDPA
ncbi:MULTISPECIES: hypothetical protein [unclassified Kitasatospora]|uniref:hypothetical protein n=1 Tax=unclassified Kitasatospora TaxID=2633591 RepID=UPI00382290F8